MENAAMNRREYPAFDIIRFVGTLLVVLIHVIPLLPKNSDIERWAGFLVQNYAARIAVPFFFASTGFFFYQRIDLCNYDSKIAKKYLIRYLRLYGTWMLLLQFNETYHLWYMPSLAVGVLLLHLLLKHGASLRTICTLAAIAYVAGLFGDSWYGLLEPARRVHVFDLCVRYYERLFSITRNGVFMGFPFVAVGAVAAKRGGGVRRSAALAGFIGSMALMLGEVLLLNRYMAMKDYNMYLFLVPAVFFLLCFARSFEIKPARIYHMLRSVGTIVYFSHLLVLQAVQWGFAACRARGVDLQSNLIVILLMLALPTLLGFAAAKLSRKPKFSLLRYLYS